MLFIAQTVTAVLELMGAVCLVQPNGHQLALNAMTCAHLGFGLLFSSFFLRSLVFPKHIFHYSNANVR
jgi:hypothetical protein